jgi:hypothetical protein
MITILFLAAFLSPAGSFADAGHHQHDADAPKIELNHGKKWVLDRKLRGEIKKIHSALGGKIVSIRENRVPVEEYVKLSTEISGSVNAIFANCKLDPKADLALHSILHEVILGAKAMNGGKEPGARRDGALKALAALERYPLFFEHPGWASVESL